LELWDSSLNNITDNTLQENDFDGIFLFSSTQNNIMNNNISFNNRRGIWPRESNGNNITSNTIYLNVDYGIYVLDSSNNHIYHNNLIDNTYQAYDNRDDNYWDFGYPQGGNYWDDYTGPDNNGDGIGDVPYDIDSNSKDYYPLMEPYSNPLMINFTILKQGWNLISIPLLQEEQNLTRVLSSIDGWYDAVQWYDNTDTNDPWKHHKVNKPFGNDLSGINETMGFWIHINQPGDTIFLYNGTQPTQNQTISLFPGWNHVGYPSLSSKNRTKALNNITFGKEVDFIWTYDASTQKGEEILEGDFFEVGRGYWIHAVTNCEWEVPL
jgi:parallel beta-helix repeat protein